MVVTVVHIRNVVDQIDVVEKENFLHIFYTLIYKHTEYQ